MGMTWRRDLLRPKRVVCGDYVYPLGVYPEYYFEQATGYSVEFTSHGEFGDRFHVQIAASHEFLAHLFIHLFTLLPETVIPLVEILSLNQKVERDLLSGQPDVLKEEYLDFFRRYKEVLIDDGFIGIGASSSDSDCEIFLTEDKIFNLFVKDTEFIDGFLSGLGILYQPKLRVFCYEMPHIHVPLNQYSGFTRKRYDYRYVRDALIDRFDLRYDLGFDESPEVTDDPRIWILDCQVLNDRWGMRPFRQKFGVKAVDRLEAIRALEYECDRNGLFLERMYEINEIILEELEPGAAAAARKKIHGVFYTWQPISPKIR